MKSICYFLMVLVLFLILSACVAGPNPLEKKANDKGEVAGFWKGIWHGMIAPITFIVSVFSKKVRFYEVHNNGFWYNFGFVLAAGLFLSGGVLGHGSKKKKK